MFSCDFHGKVGSIFHSLRIIIGRNSLLIHMILLLVNGFFIVVLLTSLHIDTELVFDLDFRV